MKTRSGVVVYPFDVLVIGYCLTMLGLLLTFGRFAQEYYDEWLFYSAMATAAALIIRFAREDSRPSVRLLRILYPALMFTFFYRATGGVMLLVFDHFHDSQIVALETSIFGIEPTLYIDQHLLNVWLNEIFSLCYFSYYLMLPVFLITLAVKKKHEMLKQSLTAVALTFFVSYLLFVLYPVEGPRWHFANTYFNSVDGPLFRSLVTGIIDHAAVRGGCMPSSHVGVALVVLMFTFKLSKRAGWALLPLNIGLAIGTFWGRFHYVSDVVVGAIIGVGSTLVVWRCYHRWTAAAPINMLTKEYQVENVS